MDLNCTGPRLKLKSPNSHVLFSSSCAEPARTVIFESEESCTDGGSPQYDVPDELDHGNI
jgi:hypothetical protein